MQLKYVVMNSKSHKNVNNPPLRAIAWHMKLRNGSIQSLQNIIWTVNIWSNQLMNLFRLVNMPKMLASLDVENIFTNVPVEETIEIMIDKVYNHHPILPPNVLRDSLRNLLFISTTKTHFKTQRGEIFKQISMGTNLLAWWEMERS